MLQLGLGHPTDIVDHPVPSATGEASGATRETAEIDFRTRDRIAHDKAGFLEAFLVTIASIEHPRNRRGRNALIGTRRTDKVTRDRKSVVSGKSVSVRVDLGGRSTLHQKKNSEIRRHK